MDRLSKFVELSFPQSACPADFCVFVLGLVGFIEHRRKDFVGFLLCEELLVCDSCGVRVGGCSIVVSEPLRSP